MNSDILRDFLGRFDCMTNMKELFFKAEQLLNSVGLAPRAVPSNHGAWMWFNYWDGDCRIDFQERSYTLKLNFFECSQRPDYVRYHSYYISNENELQELVRQVIKDNKEYENIQRKSILEEL